MKKARISMETLFWILVFIATLAVAGFIFMQAQGQSSQLLDLLPV